MRSGLAAETFAQTLRRLQVQVVRTIRGGTSTPTAEDPTVGTHGDGEGMFSFSSGDGGVPPLSLREICLNIPKTHFVSLEKYILYFRS